MALVRAGERELAQLVTDHILGAINWHVPTAIINPDGVTDEIREDSRVA